MNTNSGNIFSSNFSSSNPFNMSGNYQSPLETQLANSYAQLEALKKQAQQQVVSQPATVFTEIDAELANLSEDELHFITSSPEYQQVNNKYQAEFSQFLIQKFSAEYIQTGNSKTLEEMLFTIRKCKEKYKQKFATDINNIREQNQALMENNTKLSQNNEELKAKLEAIQKRLDAQQGEI